MADPRWPRYTWDAKARQYRGESGRFVGRKAVRQALDEFVDRAALGIERDARLLQAGAINLPEWQIRTEKNIKAIHTASAAIAAGGWAQATSADWATAARKIKAQYKFLQRFAKQIENGLPLDGRFLVRAASYASAGSGTYEAVLRRIDLASGLVIQERRQRHSLQPCPPCVYYTNLGWQPPGILPGIGDDCDCGSRCRCTFERMFAKSITIRFAPTQAAKSQDFVTVLVDVTRLDAAFQRDKGFAIGPRGEGAIAGRREGFRDFLNQARVSGAAIEQPEVMIDPSGAVAFMNGRHRFSVFRDLGVKQIPISVPRGSVAAARRHFGAK